MSEMGQDEDAYDGLDEEGEALDPEKEKKTFLEKLSMALSHKRSDAIKGRKESGIEEEWLEDDEHYEGIDDINRHELKAWRTKPMGRSYVGGEEPSGSTIFFNITRPYVDAADARVGDMLLPSNEKGWSFRPTPLPELTKIANGEIPRGIEEQIDGAFQQQLDAGSFSESEDPVEEAAQRAVKTREDLKGQVREELKQAKEKADKAEKQIEDWHVECNFQAEMRLVIADAAKCGTGCLKGPVPMYKRKVAYMDEALVVKEEICPVSLRIDPWDIFPDPSCGEDIHRGGYIFERDQITAKDLSELLEQPDYIQEALLKVLSDGPKKASKTWEAQDGDNAQNGLEDTEYTGSLYEIWYFHGRLEYQDLMLAGLIEEQEVDYAEMVDVCVTMVNNEIVKMARNHLDSGAYPYDIMVWQRRRGMPWGVGISRQIRPAQRVVNGAARNMMDNAGIAGGPMWVYQEGLVEPVDGVLEIAPRKGWIASEDADLNHLDNAFRFIQVPMMQAELQNIIALGLKFAEDITGMPLIMQGQQGAAPETVGGMQLLHNNASTVMRRIARLFDDLITEPHIRRYYEYLLQHGQDWEIKGDFEIHAKGSSALLERDAQNQYIAQMGELVMNPVFGLDPKKWMKEYLLSQRLDAEKFEYDDEQWQQTVESMSQPPADSSIEVANIRAQIEQLRIQTSAEIEQMKVAQKDSSEQRKLEFEGFLKQMDVELEQMKEQGLNSRDAENIKAMIAKEAMKLTTQERLAGMSNKPAPQVATPAVEPMGRAPTGRAFVE